jgi:NTP pyrophosphatase (non-canonical NTP hydrolase)
MGRMTPAEQLVALSRWIDAPNAHRDPEAQAWSRIAKVGEEHGEVIAAFIGAIGQNPRKGVTHSLEDVTEELLDVALTALAAVEHLRGHDGEALALLERKLERVAHRAGVLAD